MGPVNEKDVFDLIWIEPDKVYVLIARPRVDSREELEEHFKFLAECARGTASALAGANALGTSEILPIVKKVTKEHNEWYKKNIIK